MSRLLSLLASLAPRHVPLVVLMVETDAYAANPEAVAVWRCPAPLKHED